MTDLRWITADVFDGLARLDDNSVLDAALAAYDAGLCVIRGRVDGSKRPLGAWERWQKERPSRDEVAAWFHDHPALMVVCGRVSGVEMLELEGRAVVDGIAAKIDERAAELGLSELLERITAGYCERTPGGGLHLIYHCDVIEGNRKLARRPATPAELLEKPEPIKVLIETRGEGGVVMVAPSHGPTHETGRPWELTDGGFTKIATITPDERDALFALMAEFDEAGPEPAAVVKPQTPRPVVPHSGHVGSSWVDTVLAHLDTESTMQARLEAYGWTHAGVDARGVLMTRPGKTAGTSGRINLNGRLMNWSSSAPFDVSAGNHHPTFDQLDVIAAYERRGDRMAAARDIAERAGIMAAWRDEQSVIPDGGTRAVTPTTTGVNLPAEFWNERPELAHIRQAAHARSRSADAVLGCVLAGVAALTHPCWRLPAIVGAESSIATYVALVGPSGAGKSTAKTIAMRLLPEPPVTVAYDLPLGSGEGLMEAFYDYVDEDRPSGKGTVKVKRKVRDGAFLTLDEGQALADLGARKGSTLVATLRSAWTGGVIGSTNASTETKRLVPAGSYALGLVIGLQPTLATALLDDAGGGLPQRFAWFTVTDPAIPDVRPPWPGPLTWTPPPIIRNNDGLTIADAVESEVLRNDLARQRGQSATDPLDAHGDLVRLKLAACLAVLAHRNHIDADDWRLAGAIWRTSRLVRTIVTEAIHLDVRKGEDARTAAAVRREVAIVDSVETKAIGSMARSMARKVHNDAETTCPDGCAKRCLISATASKHRQLASADDAIGEAVRLRWIVPDGDKYKPGEARPT